jgi:hypothetical protein
MISEYCSQCLKSEFVWYPDHENLSKCLMVGFRDMALLFSDLEMEWSEGGNIAQLVERLPTVTKVRGLNLGAY